MTIQQLNAFCDKFTKLNTKYGGITKNKKVLVIILSNYTISQCYNKTPDDRIDAVKARFREVLLCAPKVNAFNLMIGSHKKD